MCKIWLRIATQSIALRARKHFSSVIRNKVLFTPGLWKILSLVFSQSRTTFPTSCKQHRVKITSLYFNIFFILKADKVLYKQYSAILTKNSCKILLGCIASDILSGFGQRSVWVFWQNQNEEAAKWPKLQCTLSWKSWLPGKMKGY